MKMSLYSYANKTLFFLSHAHFFFSLSLLLKMRVLELGNGQLNTTTSC